MAEINLKKLTAGVSEIDVNFNGVLEGQADATIPLNVNLTDGVNPVTPTSVALTGNDLDIEIPPTPVYMTATGGIETTDGDFKIHTFNASGDFEVLTLGDNPVIDFMLVAGGGSGGKSASGSTAGGGGAGGLIYIENQLVTLGIKPIVIGNGGASKTTRGVGFFGQNSTFLSNTAIRGGGGGESSGASGSGGSGGGSGFLSPAGLGTAGQGFNGGPQGGNAGGGGGGAGAIGAYPAGNTGGNGGIGRQTYINGTLNYFAGGGGGSPYAGVNIGLGGNGGGGNGGYAALPPISGTANTGGGGGGGYDVNSGAGGSGVCIIRYRFQ